MKVMEADPAWGNYRFYVMSNVAQFYRAFLTREEALEYIVNERLGLDNQVHHIIITNERIENGNATEES